MGYSSAIIKDEITPLTGPAAAESLQSCPTLCDPIDSSPPGTVSPGILQARTLEWVAISFSNAWKWKVKVKSLGRVQLSATPRTAAHQAPPSMGFSRQEYWSGLPLSSPLKGLEIIILREASSVQFSSVQSLSRVRLFETPWISARQAAMSIPVHHQLPEFTQTSVHQVSDAIQPSHPLSSPSPPALNPSQHQGLFQCVNSLHEVAKVLEFQLQHQSFQRNPRVDLLQNGLVGSPCSPRDSQESSPTPQFKSINSSALSLLHSRTLTSIHHHRKKYSLD